MMSQKQSIKDMNALSVRHSSDKKKELPQKAVTNKPSRAAIAVLVASKYGFDQISLASKDQPSGLMSMLGSGLAIELRSLRPQLKRTRIYISEKVIVLCSPMRGMESLSAIDIDTLVNWLANDFFELRNAAK